MKFMQIIVHTTSGQVSSASEQVTEREYEAMKETIKNSVALEFNTDNGWALIPVSNIVYVELRVE